MEDYEYYYRFDTGYIDLAKEYIIKIKSSPLPNYEFLKPQINKLKMSYENKLNFPRDIMVNVYPSIDGIDQIYVEHHIRFKFLSRKPKENYFALIAAQTNKNDKTTLFLYNTENIQEVDDILYYFIEKQQIPELHRWIKF